MLFYCDIKTLLCVLQDDTPDEWLPHSLVALT